MFETGKNTVVLKLDPQINNFLNSLAIPAGTDKKVILKKILCRIEEGNTHQQGLSKIFFLSPVYRIAISTAASLLLIFLLHFFVSKKHISGDHFHPKSHIFPDQSKVILSYDSYINFPRYWWKREVTLQGDAYFEVKSGDSFTVITNFGKVEVLGTRFFIDQQNEGLIVQCFEGAIQYRTNDDKIYHLSAGHSLKLNKQGIAELSKNFSKVPEIINFNQHFSQVRLNFVIEEISYFFQKKIELKDTGLNKHFSGRISASNIDSALMILCKPLNLNYSYSQKHEAYIISSKK